MLHKKMSYYFKTDYECQSLINYLFTKTHYYVFTSKLIYENHCGSKVIITSDLIVFNSRLNRFREFNNNCYAYRRLMCLQNIIVITQIFEIFRSCLFIHMIHLFVVCNAFSVDWLISTRIR